MEMDSSDVQVSLTKAASDYSPPVTVLGTLEPFKDAILTLRAKSASYETIMELLTQHGIKISVSSVRRFCRGNQSQIRRLRTDLFPKKKEQANEFSEARDLTHNQAPSTHLLSTPRPPRDMRGPV